MGVQYIRPFRIYKGGSEWAVWFTIIYELGDGRLLYQFMVLDMRPYINHSRLIFSGLAILGEYDLADVSEDEFMRLTKEAILFWIETN